MKNIGANTHRHIWIVIKGNLQTGHPQIHKNQELEDDIETYKQLEVENKPKKKQGKAINVSRITTVCCVVGGTSMTAIYLM